MISESLVDGLVRVLEAARILSLSRSKIYAMMDAGELVYVKLGKSRRIPLAALANLIERHTVRGNEKQATDSP